MTLIVKNNKTKKMTLHTYIETHETRITRFSPKYPATNSAVTSSYFTLDGSAPAISNSRVATFEEIDDLAEKMGLVGWNNQH